MRGVWLLVLLAACASEQVFYDFNDYQGRLDPPLSYRAVQVYSDSGFSGVDGSFSEAEFTVVDEVPDSVDSQVEPWSMTDAKDESWSFDFFGDDRLLFADVVCFFHVQAPVTRAVVCFEDDRLVYFASERSMGNHQRVVESWRLASFELFDEGCRERDFFCPIFETALSQNPDACSTVVEAVGCA